MIKNLLFLRYWQETKGLGFQPAEINVSLGLYPPIGLAQIAAVCKRAGYRVKILDVQALRLSVDQIKTEIASFSPDFLGLSLWTSSFEGDIAGAKLVKEIDNDVVVVAGGPHMDLYAKETMARYDIIDYAVIGEGEETIIELLETLNQRGNCENVKGIVFRKNGQLLQNQPRDIIEDLDEIPFPLINELSLDCYHSVMATGKRAIYALTTRGCPFKCKYCVDQQFGRTVRFHSPGYIVNYLKYLVDDLGIRELHFYDDTFTLNKKRTIDICNAIVKNNLQRIPWTIRTRPDRIDEDILAALKKARCRRIGFGVESGNQRILDLMNRQMTLEQISRAFKLTKEYGFEVIANFMIGYLGESRQTFKETVNFAKKLDPDYAMFSITIVQPNSDLYRDMQQSGSVVRDYWREYVTGKVKKLDTGLMRIPGEDYSSASLSKMQAKAYLVFYFRPRQIFRYLKKVSGFRQLARHVVMAVSMLRVYLRTVFSH